MKLVRMIECTHITTMTRKVRFSIMKKVVVSMRERLCNK